MAIKINNEVIDQIIFGMENQSQEFVFDLDTGEVVVFEEGTSFVDLPEWNSSMGFQLMEKFVSNLRNPIYHETLLDSLSGGRGVFRRFKNALKERPEIEQLWFQFKEREMKRYVIEWFEAMQETRRLEEVQVEVEETEELVLTDFSIGFEEDGDLSEYVEYDKRAFSENYPDLPDRIVMEYYDSVRTSAGCRPTDILRAETPKGDLAGFVWLYEPPDEEKQEVSATFARVLQLYVLPEYRGLGLARTLMEFIMDDAYKRGVGWLFIEAHGEAAGFADAVAAEGFSRHSIGLSLNLERWGLENR